MDPVIELVERSNQRGGRMLSVLDLLEAGTLSLPRAAWLLARIERGASWLVGAVPGGAGKTTVMSALLAMLPAGERVRLASPGTGWESSAPGECVVAYEISPGPYEAYIWGEPVRRLARLGRSGCRIVTNLHADTLEQARRQIVEDNGVPAEDFDAFGMFLPVSVGGGLTRSRREVRAIHYHENGAWRKRDGTAPAAEREAHIETFLRDCQDKGLRPVNEVRTAWLSWLNNR